MRTTVGVAEIRHLLQGIDKGAHRSLHYHNEEYPSFSAANLKQPCPHSYRTTGGNNALFSRYPILDARSDLLGVSIPGRTYNLVARLQLEKDEVTLVGFHPPIPPIRHLFHVRNRQLDALARYVQPLNEKVIVLGDFNTTPWSPYLRRFESKAFLKNAGQGRGIRATWNYHAKFPMSWLKVPIDHIEIRGFQVSHTWVGDPGGSDHAPIIAILKAE